MRAGLSGLMGLLFVVSACQKSEDSSSQGESQEVITQKLAISGNLKNGEDKENVDAVKDQEVKLLRNDGKVVAQGNSNAKGAFTLEVAAGQLVVDSGYTLAGANEEPTDSAELGFTYTLEVKVPDDGKGKAIGIRRRLSLTTSDISEVVDETAKVEAGENSLKEISAIVGKVRFADEYVSAEDVDVYIPGQSFYLRTDAEGAFNLLFVPEGSYTVRMSKGIYIKDISVSVEAGKTTNIDTVEIALEDRNPQPLSQVIVGEWKSTCYAGAGSHAPDDATTGTLTVVSGTSFSYTGDSCLLHTVLSAQSTMVAIMVPSDGIIIVKNNVNPSGYFYNEVLSYSNERIIVNIDFGSNENAVEVLERVSE